MLWTLPDSWNYNWYLRAPFPANYPVGKSRFFTHFPAETSRVSRPIHVYTCTSTIDVLYSLAVSMLLLVVAWYMAEWSISVPIANAQSRSWKTPIKFRPREIRHTYALLAIEEPIEMISQGANFCR